ncbi:2-polyprenyl-6-methoxyphenol hydroxylase [Catalinimonas alkaloidigena]|uniref:2-polyprenyl-6-methoxyphenol hydroxylase n=1 Tax=Catalinimonas alkaloidigena TaxID=1075417 RepID=A0A1G9ATU7_9BACT|nr:FAD-dependent monooxygenase [Catalinimonas alkaloidigena]SDK30643.1 2-polyprenyl-6-methoxyphenol hydroxylase [Catalinimonas alkaloidigena]
MKNISIVGGGIAGLTTAIALEKIGLRPHLFDATTELHPVGAGLALSSNALKAYHHLGIDDQVLHAGHPLPGLRILDQRGDLISEAPVPTAFPNVAVHRADLHDLLRSQLCYTTVHLGKQATGFTTAGEAITVHFQDGSHFTTDYLIAADGIHSAVRQQLLPSSRARYAGYTCWRAVLENPGVSLPAATETWGVGKRFGLVPLSNHRIYWFACLNAAERDPQVRNYTLAQVKQLFQDFHAPVTAVLDATAPEALLHNDICDLKPLPRYAFGNIVLVGDAAHATTPNLGQGACQAIEDAVILGECLRASSVPEEAFRRFERKRLARTHYVITTSRRVGQVAQWENRWLIGARNALFRALPARLQERQLAWLDAVAFTGE